MSIKRFREFTGSPIDEQELKESSLLNKGFALSQAARHRSKRQQLEGALSRADSLFSRASGNKSPRSLASNHSALPD